MFEQTFINAIENIADKKINDIHSIDLEHEKIIDEKNSLIRDISTVSFELDCKPVILNKDYGSITDLSNTTNFIKRIEAKIQEGWLRDIKNYYQVDIQSNDFETYINHPIKTHQKVKKINRKIDIETWRKVRGELFEWYTALTIIKNFYKHRNESSTIQIDLTGSLTIPLQINDRTYFFGSQIRVDNKLFGMPVQPDFVLTDNQSINFNYSDVVGIIECKNLDGNIGGKEIRDIFGKGWQLLPYSVCLFSRGRLTDDNLRKIQSFGMNVIDDFNSNYSLSENFKQDFGDLYKTNLFKDKLTQYLFRKFG